MSTDDDLFRATQQQFLAWLGERRGGAKKATVEEIAANFCTDIVVPQPATIEIWEGGDEEAAIAAWRNRKT